ncbi:MAG: NAD-dependent protein deacetylase [Myxococcaceae bacterium]|nr:NAD-dependent protein deacetylase [Myxococcaceae bacterium]
MTNDLERAAEAIIEASAFVFAAGAGMGVDSGLPDFRGDEGFWKAYPPYAKLGLSFVALANPRWFEEDPSLAWGFYGHRRNLYRATTPHAGFTVLRRLAERAKNGAFVFTSNVDAQFQRAGFAEERVFECHGSLEHLQCTASCREVWAADASSIAVDEATFRAREPLPRCRCGALARPNVLMFGDGDWLAERAEEQEGRLGAFLEQVTGPLVVVECGAGTAVPSVRRFSETMCSEGATLIRVNVREPAVPRGQVGLPLGAKDALQRLEALVDARR